MRSWNYHSARSPSNPQNVRSPGSLWNDRLIPLPPPPTPKKERFNPASAGHSALWGSSSRRRDGSDGRTGGERQTTSLPIPPQLKKQRQPPSSPGRLYTSQRGFPISRCRLASRPRPHDKEKPLGEQGLPASTSGGRGLPR